MNILIAMLLHKSSKKISAFLFSMMIFITPQIIYAKSNFLIWPIYPVIESQEKATPVWLENVGDEASMIQVRVFKWSQNNNQDQYENQQEIIASPPIVKVAAGDKQMIRLTKAANVENGKEYSYRVIIDELPINLEQNDDVTSVSFKMRYSLPLFVYGKGLGSGNNIDTKKINNKNPNARPILSWSIVNTNNRDYLEVNNSGLLSVRISGFKIDGKDYKSVSGSNTFGYVLAGGKFVFDINQEFKSLLLKNKPVYAVIGQDKDPIPLVRK